MIEFAIGQEKKIPPDRLYPACSNANTCLAKHVRNLELDVILSDMVLPNTIESVAVKPERKRSRVESRTPPKNIVQTKVSSVEMSSYQGLDAILKNWHFDPHSLAVRLVKGEDGRDVIQMRVDLGVLQMETNGRPDGQEVDGHSTFLDALLDSEKSDPEFVMSDKQCFEADREFVQFYHRRISWLRLEHYHRAVEDADHTLALMDVCRDHSPEEEWTMSHEQYRPFVLFHRTQAAALASLDDSSPDEAVKEINAGLEAVRAVFEEHEAIDEFDSDEMVQQLIRLRESIRNEYEVGESLQDRLAAAVRDEQYELAAKLRDELARKQAH